MNPAKCDELDYIHFLIASVDVFTCTEAARCRPGGEKNPSHDAFIRLLQRQLPDTDVLWNEIIHIVLVYHQWSGKQHSLVNGINICTLLWTGGASIKIFRIVSKDGDIGYWATDMREMDEVKREVMGEYSWKIEEYHRGIKQFCEVENCQARKNRSQRAHIIFSLRAFIGLEVERLSMGRSWFESKRRIICQAISAYIINPNYSLSRPPTPQVLSEYNEKIFNNSMTLNKGYSELHTDHAGQLIHL